MRAPIAMGFWALRGRALSTTGEDIVECAKEVVAANQARDAANLLVVLEDDEGWHQSDGLGETELAKRWIINIDKADRRLLAVQGRLVGGQELTPEDIAVNATVRLENDELEFRRSGGVGLQIACSLGDRQRGQDGETKDQK